MTDQRLRTWDLRHEYHGTWLRMEQTGTGLERLPCGCFVDRFNVGKIWEPCMAHEGDGHVSGISEQDGMHVARCLVLRCAWSETQLWESGAISAAQQHWVSTREQHGQGLTGSN